MGKESYGEALAMPVLLKKEKGNVIYPEENENVTSEVGFQVFPVIFPSEYLWPLEIEGEE